MVEHARRDLLASGQGSLMLKFDLESAFRHILVCQEDWPLLGFEWLGGRYPHVRRPTYSTSSRKCRKRLPAIRRGGGVGYFPVTQVHLLFVICRYSILSIGG